MKNNFLLSLIAIALLGCQPSIKPNFTIQGTIDGEFEGYVYLVYKGVTDSALVNSGSFLFSGNVDYPVSAVLIPKSGATASSLYFGQENISLTVEPKGNVFFLNDIKGSRIIDGMEPTLNSFRAVLESDDNPAPKIFEMSKKLIDEDPTNPFYSDIILDLATDSEFYSISEVNQLIAAMAPSAIDAQSLDAVQTVLARMANLNVGDQFPGFDLPTMEGQTIALPNLKDSYVLVDLWASWCGPCIKAMPTIKKMSEKYADNDFKAISISLDQREEVWKRTNERLDITWINALDSNGLEGGLSVELGVTFLPFYYLVDKEGKILAINISLADAEATLDKLFSE